MSFGRNPHVAKAEAAEQKAESAKDGIAREQALRDAAHQWDRAAQREKDARRKQLYADKAATLRANADAVQATPIEPSNADAAPMLEHHASGAIKKPSLLN
jgi:hypothetical protein